MSEREIRHMRPRTDAKDKKQSALSAKISELAKEHPEWEHDQVIAVAHSKLGIARLKKDAGGEGTRGGIIIGRTKTGKPIYGRHSHPAHGTFNKQEHREAAEAHTDLAKKKTTSRAQLGVDNPTGKQLAKEIDQHHEQAAKHKAEVASAGARVEKSKAGRVERQKAKLKEIIARRQK